jgi:acetyl-CoA carboxylase biotin carboxylase subunit
MIAKLIVKGATREDAIRHAKRALKEFHIAGIHSTIPFHQYMLDDPNFISNNYTIQYIDQLLEQGCTFQGASV